MRGCVALISKRTRRGRNNVIQSLIISNELLDFQIPAFVLKCATAEEELTLMIT